MTPKPAAVKADLEALPSLKSHPRYDALIEVVTGETNVSSAGYPYISDRSFRVFIENVAHLFERGGAVLSWLNILTAELPDIAASPAAMESIQRAVKVLRTTVLTAGVTAPPDLWLLRQVLGTHRQIGTLDWLLAGNAIEPEVYAAAEGLQLKQLQADLQFLYSRGFLRKGDANFLLSEKSTVAGVLRSLEPIHPQYQIDFVPRLTDWITGAARSDAAETFLRDWLYVGVLENPTGSWQPNHFQIELGYRLLPLVLSLRVAGLHSELDEGVVLEKAVPSMLSAMSYLLERAGFTKKGRVSELGARVFQRGAGPFGIIGAYHPYLSHHESLLRSGKTGLWVRRGENVAASQDANSKTFKMANDRLDRFCAAYDFSYTIFIEHAVGQGEAVRQRLERSGEDTIRYFGADLEDAAIEQARRYRDQGKLPQNMRFIQSADIGEPDRVIQFLIKVGVAGEPTVMMVGNGFHEIRQQTNEKMTAVFEAYQEAGFVLVFTEESALSDEALLHTAWNTYHAGFRYVHQVSGQGLRPAIEREDAKRWSWLKCAKRGGYVVLDEFSYRSRTIYPHKRAAGKNPSISVTYFCVPSKLATQLGLEPV
jgi:hypothetical protein